MGLEKITKENYKELTSKLSPDTLEALRDIYENKNPKKVNIDLKEYVSDRIKMCIPDKPYIQFIDDEEFLMTNQWVFMIKHDIKIPWYLIEDIVDNNCLPSSLIPDIPLDLKDALSNLISFTYKKNTGEIRDIMELAKEENEKKIKREKEEQKKKEIEEEREKIRIKGRKRVILLLKIIGFIIYTITVSIITLLTYAYFYL